MFFKSRYSCFLLFLFILVSCGEHESLLPVVLIDVENKVDVKEIHSFSGGVSFKPQGNFVSYPIGNDNIIVPSENSVISVNLSKGVTNWVVDLKEEYIKHLSLTDSSVDTAGFTGSSVVHNGVIYLFSEFGYVFAVDVNKGKVLKVSKGFQKEFSSNALIYNNNLYIQASDNSLVCIGINDLKQKWIYQRQSSLLSIRGSSTPILVRNKIVFGSSDGLIVFLDPKSGALIKSFQISYSGGFDIISNISDIDSNIVYDKYFHLLSFNSGFFAFDERKSAVSWSLPDIKGSKNYILHNDIFYISDRDDIVYAVDRKGSVKWSNSLFARRSLSSFVVIGNILVFGDYEGFLHFLDIKDGDYIGRHNVSSEGLFGLKVIGANKLFVNSYMGDSYLFSINYKQKK